MALVPIKLPAGFYRNGTEFEASNRWRDGSLVRWLDGSLKPIGGWTTRKAAFANNPVRGMHSWQANDGTAWLAGGSHDQLIAMTGAGICYDLTPDDLAAGREDAAVNTGYGFGFYGTGYYGQPRAVTTDSVPQEATTWQLDNFGQNLVALHQDDGRIFEWNLTTTVGAELVTNGAFASDANWNKGTNWSISGGVAEYAQYKPSFDANNTTIVDVANDTITINGHNFVNNDEVTYVVPSGQVAIDGLTSGTNYFIVSATTNTFKLSATSGGSAINISANKQVTFDADNNSVKDTTNNKIVVSNTFTNGDEVSYSNGSGTDIGGLVNNQNYFIVNASSSEFQLAATSGGSAIDLTADLNVAFDPNGISTSPTSVTVTVANVGGVNKFHFDGVTAPAIALIRGTTYTFDLSDNSNSGHPLVFANGGSSYTTGITTTGTAGTSGASVTFAVPANAPATGLTYLCSIHGAGMGNSITTVAVGGGPIDYSTETITINNHGLSNGNEVTYSNGGGTNIGGLTTGTNYFVISATTNTFKLSATSGGSAINLTDAGGSLGTNHSFDLDIGSSHVLRQDIGSTHQLQRVNFGNLDQTASGLVATPDAQDSYDVTVDLIDPNDDSNTATVPNVKIKVTGTTSTTVLVHETLAVGSNIFRFGADDTAVKIEIIPQAYNTPNFDIDNISLRKKTVAEPIANAPINNKGIVVTEERFIFALGAGGNSRKVQWCDKENNTQWTPAATNEAGDIELATSGQIMCGVRTRGVTLIITDTDAHMAQYIAPPYVYSFQRVGTNCGAVSRLSAVATDQGAFWYGQENFHYFDGNSVQTLNCDVQDYVFNDFNQAQQSKVWGMVNGANNEIWWFYCSANSTEIDRYVAYDFKDNHWLIGNLSRTSGVSRGVFAYPFMAKHGTKTDIMNHEIGFNYEGSSIFCETGPVSIGNGDQVAKVTEVITDEKTQGDVDLKFKTKFNPNDTERTFGPFNPSNPTSLRFTGRQLKMRVEGDQATDWRVGVMRLEVKAGGRR
tara:strand:- start:371 stop:3406 length:3036 start_codon:yes stop_codon:yes gene_type:complete